MPKIKPSQAISKLNNFGLCKQWEKLTTEEKISNRIGAFEELQENLRNKRKANADMTEQGPYIIKAMENYMGWQTKDANNPLLAKGNMEILEIVFLQSKKQLHKGYAISILPFLVDKMQDRRFAKQAESCLWCMTYHFKPKVVVSNMLKLLLEIPSEKNRAPNIAFCAKAIMEFGVHNCDILQNLYYIQKYYSEFKAEGKIACKNAITTIYQQMGDNWDLICFGNLEENIRKALQSEFNGQQNKGKTIQKRICLGETPPENTKKKAKAKKKTKKKGKASKKGKKKKKVVVDDSDDDDDDDDIKDDGMVRVNPDAVVSKDEIKEIKNVISNLDKQINEIERNIEEVTNEIKKSSVGTRRKIVKGIKASTSDLFENLLVNVIGMGHYLPKFVAAKANDIRMVEHFDIPFLKDKIGVSNKLEGKLLVKFIGKFNDETVSFRDWMTKQKLMKRYINIFESKGVITWSILDDFCENKDDIKKAFKMKNDKHATYLYECLLRWRNGEITDE